MNASSHRFDAIIIGAGQAGPPLAARLTEAGMQVALIERKYVGGTCVNTGCMPTKTLIASARAAHMARRGAEFGILTARVEVDMRVVASRARRVVEDARRSNETWLASMNGLHLVRGHARFADASTIVVGEQRFDAPRIFLDVGGRAHVPAMRGVNSVPYLDNTDMAVLDRVPEHLIVVGGGPVGLEFAQMYRRFGARVTIVERNARLAAREDEDISAAMRAALEAEGIDVRTNADCIGLERDGARIVVTLDCVAGDRVVSGSDVLMAVGRRPNTDDLDLAAAGIEADPRGYVRVDETLRTNVEGIWALGECNGRGNFTHTAYNDFEIVAANLLDGASRSLGMRVQGYALYTDPPLGRAGLTEAEAIAEGHDILVSTRPMSRVGRAIETGETTGLMKLVADAHSRRILGAAIFGIGGDEAIHAVLNLMSAGQSVDALRWAVPIHPTIAELLPTLAVDLRRPGRANDDNAPGQTR